MFNDIHTLSEMFHRSAAQLWPKSRSNIYIQFSSEAFISDLFATEKMHFSTKFFVLG